MAKAEDLLEVAKTLKALTDSFLRAMGESGKLTVDEVNKINVRARDLFENRLNWM